MVHGPRSLSALLALAVGLAMSPMTGATEYFVATNGLDDGSNNGLGWDQPLLTISNAVAKGDVTIVTVSNGTYNISTQINVTAAITVRSFGNGVYGGLANAANTTINAGSVDGRRVMYVDHAGAVIDGLTMTGGQRQDGAGAQLIAGTVQNCRITGNNLGSNAGKQGALYVAAGGLASNCHVVANTANNQFFGIGIYISGGTVRRSNISNNSANSETYAQGGIGIYSGSAASLIDSCVITNNRVLSFGDTGYGGGAGVSLRDGGTVRNSLIAGNVSKKEGGGVYGTHPASIVENCTIVGNASTNNAGGVFGCMVTNSIVYFNTSTNVAQNWSGGSMAYSCTTPTNGLTGPGNISDAPLFADESAGDYRLRSRFPLSPCIDKGTNQAWMVGANDLAGMDRILKQIVDMGCYETYVAPEGTVLTVQ